ITGFSQLARNRYIASYGAGCRESGEGPFDMRLLAEFGCCAAMCAVGFVMARRPMVYRRWVERSWAGQHMPRMTQSWLQHQRTYQTLGILFMAFAVCSFIGF